MVILRRYGCFIFILWTAIVILILGCDLGSPWPDQECTQTDGQLGDCCHSDQDCQDPWICVTEFPGGICSHDCEPNPSCTDISHCVRIKVEGVGHVGALCLLDCLMDDPQCRPGYRCWQVGETSINVCFPEENQ
jgi:hypothetical protein